MTPTKTNFTIATSGVLLLLSGLMSLLSLTAPVALFGTLHAGAVAVLYNGLFAGLLAVMGYALTARKPWALPVTWAASLFYTIDKLEMIFDPAARTAALGEAASMLGEFSELVENVLVWVGVLFVLSWWLFVLYLYLRRAYFQPAAQPPSESPKPAH